MDALIEWGYGVIAGVQTLRSPVADIVFHALTFLGEELFFILFIPVLYWLVDKRFATRFAVLIMGSVYLNGLLKVWAAQPRPSVDRVAVLADAPGGGLPSGHAQNAVVTWGYLGHALRRRALLAGAIGLALAIGFSRVYLGVHFPQDVITGWIVGGLVLTGFILGAPPLERWIRGYSLAVQTLAGAGTALALVALAQDELSTTAAAVLLGLALAIPLERSRIGFDAAGADWLRGAARLVLGLAVTLLIWRGLKPVLLPLDELGRVLRYALLGLWVGAGAPWAFVRLGLARREAETADELTPVPAD